MLILIKKEVGLSAITVTIVTRTNAIQILTCGPTRVLKTHVMNVINTIKR